MGRIRQRFFFALVLLSWSESHPQTRPLVFSELTDAALSGIDIHDGSVADWIDVLGEPTTDSRDFLEVGGQSFGDQADFAFRAWLAWHADTNRLYFAFEWFDDIYVNRFAPGAFDRFGNDGDLWITVDADQRGPNQRLSSTHYDSHRDWLLAQNYAAQDYRAVFHRYSNVSILGLRNVPDGWWGLPPYGDGSGGQFGEQPIITVLELYLTPFDRLVLDDPEASLVSELRPGQTIDIRIQTQDWDSASDYRQFSYPGATAILLPDSKALGMSAPTHTFWASVKLQVERP